MILVGPADKAHSWGSAESFIYYVTGIWYDKWYITHARMYAHVIQGHPSSVWGAGMT